MKRYIMKITYLITAVILALAAVASGIFPAAAVSVASAENMQVTDFEHSPIAEDLKDVNILKYPKNPLGTHSLMSFMEYCYSERPFLSETYGIYLYIYNPTEKEIRTETIANTVELATSYDLDGAPTDYETLSLTYLDRTGNNRFYKFKIADSLSVLTQAKSYASAHEGVRRYDVSSVQLWFKDGTTATDEAVSKTYRWTGFAKGCGADYTAESTLDCTVSNLLSLDIPLRHTNSDGEQIQQQTYYRTGSSSLGENHSWQIDTVYFSIPANIENYGTYDFLQTITAQWYEYQTKEIYVTSDSAIKSAFTPYIGVDISNKTAQELYSNGYGFGSYVNRTGTASDTIFNWDWGYGLFEYPYQVQKPADIGYYSNEVNELRTQIDWLFQVPASDKITVSSSELFSFMESYSKKYGASTTDEYLSLLGYSDQLFTDKTAVHGDGKQATRGYNRFTFDTKETFDLSSYESTLNGWQKFWKNLYGVDVSEWNIADFSPIEEVTASDISSLYGTTELSESLKINTADAEEFRAWANTELKKGQRVYLFRFAVTDYTQEQIQVQKFSGNGAPYSGKMACAQEAVFLGFEMITIGLNKNDKLTIIPVVQSPIHIVDGVDINIGGGDDNGQEWWKIILGVLLLILLIIVLQVMGILPLVTHLIGWVILLPFRLIGGIFKGIGKLFHKKD